MQTNDADLVPTTIPQTQPKRMRRMAREPQPRPSDIPDTGSPVEPRTTKASAIEALLRRDGGVALNALCSATGWQPHTCRAFLTGLRKKGHAIDKTKGDDGVTRWSVSDAKAT
ncbi:DUF3489 domain-containing protein [Novosphingobium sp. NDB2Meth1]|uniref:DUF3489 domain-containing protein n=1 Tax=Novosphingobium sp. NDB2Meth1 TaxID=1892847 RepID=UPI0009FB1028|nr:DUF3489 domain-containing protein [Novosphingobium sp. NDB2Meth1]